MKKSTKRNIATVAACAMLGCVAVGGTLAYLTDATETDTINTYTVGKVEIDLTETKWPDDPNVTGDEVVNLVSNATVAKNPTVENTGNNDAIVFVSVEIPKQEFAKVDADGKVHTKASHEVAIFKTEEEYAEANTPSSDWCIVKKDETNDDCTIYVLGYKGVLAVGETTNSAAFEYIQIANSNNDLAGNDIIVNAYAIQANNIVSTSEFINVADGVSGDELTEIYNIYVNQAKGAPVTP